MKAKMTPRNGSHCPQSTRASESFDSALCQLPAHPRLSIAEQDKESSPREVRPGMWPSNGRAFRVTAEAPGARGAGKNDSQACT